MNLTHIAGDLSKTGLKLEAEKVREALRLDRDPLVVRGYCNNRRANYAVGVGEFPRDPIIWIDQKSEKPVKDYCKKSELPEKIKRDSIYLMHLTLDIGHLFPYHNVVLACNTSLAAFNEELGGRAKVLEELRYDVFPKPSRNSSNHWNNEMQVRLLAVLRDSRSNANAADGRAVKILQTIYEHIDINPNECTFTLAE